MLEVEAVWKKRYHVEVMARQFRVENDEPPKFGGDDIGMMPTELFLGSIATCFCLALVYAAKNRNIKLDDVCVKVFGDKDLKSFMFNRIIVRVITSLPQENLDEIMPLAKKYCFVSNTVTKSCPIEYETGEPEA
ncbi:MAG: OsmC family protein [Thermodesulfobacteriota bacterium]